MIGENYAWQLADFRARVGPVVTFNGATYACTTGPVAGAQVGIEVLPRQAFGAFSADFDPRVFRLNPQDFSPTTAISPPTPGAELTFQGLVYRITRVVPDVLTQDDQHALNCFGFHEITDAIGSPILPLTDSAVVYRKTLTDDGMGSQSHAWAALATLACRLVHSDIPLEGEPDNAERQEARSRWACKFPVGSDILPSDRLIVTTHANGVATDMRFEITETDQGLTGASELTATLLRVNRWETV